LSFYHQEVDILTLHKRLQSRGLKITDGPSHFLMTRA
jgi:hypothetical protein